VYPQSPDPRGTHALLIAAEDGKQGHRESMWLAPLDGGAAVRLGPYAGVVRKAAWAPDGSWIAFESDAASYRDLYRIGRDGTGYARLTDAEHGSFEPAISPDGTTILMGTSRDGNAEVYATNADGSAPRRLTDHPMDDVHPGWSPDGRTVTWISFREGSPRVWRMAPDGSDPRPVRSDERQLVDLDFAWSPDGARLAIVSQSGPKEVEIAIVEPSSGRVLATIDGPGPDEQPTWSPDGRWLAFTSSREGSADVFLATADGRSVQRLTSGADADWLPRWLP
jgi:Tol biopolymer transport system component